MGEIEKAILRTLAYADIFDYPLTVEEIHRFLIGQDAKGKRQDEIKEQLAKNSYLVSRISSHDGFYFLQGRKKIVARRKKRERWSQKKREIARKVAKWFRLIPTIKMVAVTGALAMANSDQDDDIDLLIVTSKNRLWLTRLLAVCLVELVAQRRRPGDKKVKDKICLNMFLDEEHLMVPKKEQDLFSAHEVCQLKPLWEKDEVYRKFIKENQWVKQFLPNAFKTPRRWSQSKSHFTTPPRWSNLEALARRAQLWYMSSRKTTEITEPGRICFHPQDARKWVLKEYKKRLKKLRASKQPNA